MGFINHQAFLPAEHSVLMTDNFYACRATGKCAGVLVLCLAVATIGEFAAQIMKLERGTFIAVHLNIGCRELCRKLKQQFFVNC